MTTKCFKKIHNVWYGVVLDDSKSVLSCGFTINGKKSITKSVLSSLPTGLSIQETPSNKYALTILESSSLIYEGKDPKAIPEFTWERLPKFYRKALKLTAMIPKGKVATYANIAKGIGEPKSARAVGNAEASNPFAPFVPCHRVISSSLGLGGYGGGLDLKRELLNKEGIIFVKNHVARECVCIPNANKSL